MQKLHQSFSTRQTPQTEPVPGSNQVANNAGGFGWQVDDWTRLERFLILGTEGGTYYVNEKKLTKESAEACLRCIKADGKRAVERVLAISDAGHAPKNDPALFLLAMCSAFGDNETRRAAFSVLPRVARIGTHLFHFAEFRQAFAGWGRSMRKAIRKWYLDLPPERLAYQAVKYQSRDGWSHRDLLRLSHPKNTESHQPIFKWIISGKIEGNVPNIIEAFEKAKTASVPQLLTLIKDQKLPREALPTEMLNKPEIWEALLDDMPMTAMVRNLGNMGKCGLLAPMSKASAKVMDTLADKDLIKKSRLHPIQILAALLTYQSGQGLRGKGTWRPVQQVVDALNDAFYLAFDNVEPIGKKVLLAIDCSGSMSGQSVAGIPNMNTAYGAAAMALVTARTEKQHAIVIFNDEIRNFSISPRQRLDDVYTALQHRIGGGTDCSAPIRWATDQKVDCDAIMVYSDQETWAGNIHAHQALRIHREKTKINTKIGWVAMAGNHVTLKDPGDPLAMDFIGFDPSIPKVIADFLK